MHIRCFFYGFFWSSLVAVVTLVFWPGCSEMPRISIHWSNGRVCSSHWRMEFLGNAMLYSPT